RLRRRRLAGRPPALGLLLVPDPLLRRRVHQGLRPEVRLAHRSRIRCRGRDPGSARRTGNARPGPRRRRPSPPPLPPRPRGRLTRQEHRAKSTAATEDEGRTTAILGPSSSVAAVFLGPLPPPPVRSRPPHLRPRGDLEPRHPPGAGIPLRDSSLQ